MTEVVTSSAEMPRSTVGGRRMIVGLCAALLVDSVIMIAAPAAFVAVLIVPLVGLVAVAIFAAVLGLATAGALWLVTRVRHVAAGFAAGITGAVAAAALLLSAGRIPVWWVPELGVDLGVVPAAIVAVAAAAVFLPRWWVRLTGAVLLLGAVTAFAGSGIVADIQTRDAEAEAQRQVERDALERQLDTFVRPVVTDWDGATRHAVGGGESDAMVFYSTGGGGALRILTVDDVSDSERAVYACWLMDPVSGVFDDSVTTAQYDGICGVTADGRIRLQDGSAIAVEMDDSLVVVSSLGDTYWSDVGATRAATDDEIELAAGRLRVLGREEFRTALIERWESGEL